MTRFDRIVVAVDFSEHSSRAIEMSARRFLRSRVTHRLSSRRTDAGVSAGSSDPSSSRVITKASVSETSSPAKALCPVSIS